MACGGKIVFFVPNPGDKDLVEKLFREEYDGNWELEVGYTTGVREIQRKQIIADAVIARGMTGEAAKHMLTGIPVIDFPVTGYDIIRAIDECRRRFHIRRIAVVGAANMIIGVKTIEQAMNIRLETVKIADEQGAQDQLRRLREKGIDTIIGGGTAVLFARELGMNAVMIPYGQEAIGQALREARRVVEVRRREQERAEQFRMILDYSLEGIMAVDDAGGLTLVNKSAAEMAGINPTKLMKQADAILDQLRVKRVLETGAAELGGVEIIRGRQFAVNCVPVTVRNRTSGAIITFQPIAAIQELEGKIRRKISRRGYTAKFSFSDIVAESPAMRHVIELAKEYSRVDSSILILGETGVGKEVVAQSVHSQSPRRAEPFVPVNCAALPENLLESELFGYADGAFTGAARGGKMGLFEQAHRGSIFLDEIAELSPKLQARLLRVLQEREIMRLGDDKVIPVDVRVIAATNRDLGAMMAAGSFRCDLYYRLDVLKIVIPPLRERGEDILSLLARFMENYAARFGQPLPQLTDQAKRVLAEYAWPGNVRELRNIAERLMVLVKRPGERVEAEDMRAVLFLAETGRPAGPAGAAGDSAGQGFRGYKKAAQLAHIREVLEETHYDYARTAGKLGISRTTLWRRLQELRSENI